MKKRNLKYGIFVLLSLFSNFILAQQPTTADDIVITSNLADVTGLTKLGDADITKTGFMGKPENLSKKATDDLKRQALTKGANVLYLSSNQFMPDTRTYLNKVHITGAFYKMAIVSQQNGVLQGDSPKTTNPNSIIDFNITGCTGDAAAQTVTVYFTFANPRKVHQKIMVSTSSHAVDNDGNTVSASLVTLSNANSSGSGWALIELITGGVTKGSITFINVLPVIKALSLVNIHTRSSNWSDDGDVRVYEIEIRNLAIDWGNKSTLPTGNSTNAPNADYVTYNDLLAKLNDGQDTKNKKIILDNIYFETNSDVLADDSKTTLQNVLKLLVKYPKLKITILGHTDNVGRDDDNLSLSIGRAHAVVSYLVSKGIDRDRMFYKGFGSTIPLGDNSTEDGRAKNRRTEMEIMEQ